MIKNFLQLFSSSCIKRTHLYKAFQLNENLSSTARRIHIHSKYTGDHSPQRTASRGGYRVI